jgi:hypothetical protein
LPKAEQKAPETAVRASKIPENGRVTPHEAKDVKQLVKVFVYFERINKAIWSIRQSAGDCGNVAA